LSAQNPMHVRISTIVLERLRHLMTYSDCRWKDMSLLSLYARFYACVAVHAESSFEFNLVKHSLTRNNEVIEPRKVGRQLYDDMEYLMDVECLPKTFVPTESLCKTTVSQFGARFFPQATSEELFWAAISFARTPFIPRNVDHRKSALHFSEDDLDCLSLVSNALFPLFS
jgi:hypothetical protein